MLPLVRTVLRAAACLVAAAAPLVAADHDSNYGRKIDRALRESLKVGERTRRVIITMNPGCRASILDALRRHGDRVKSEHPLINALSAESHTEDIEELAKHPCVQSVAADADVSAADGAPQTRAAGRQNAAARAAKNTKDKARSKSRSDGDDDDDDDDDGAARRRNGASREDENSARQRPSPVPAPQAPPNVLRETLGLSRVATADIDGATGIGVAIIDSGIAPNDDFAGRIVGFYDFTRGGVATSPYDDYGHGTHVAGLIGASGRLSNYEFQGIAPAVHMVGLKVLDSKGQGRTSDVISALEFVVANRARLNVHIVNISLGHPIYAPAKDDPLVQAVEQATAAGLIVVVSAGNYGIQKKNGDAGYTGITSPGNARSAITVGSSINHGTVTRADDAVAPYSGRGPSWFDAAAKPDVVAPGYGLQSATTAGSYLYNNLITLRRQARNGQPLLELSGTSMATAVTTGVIALVIQQHNTNPPHRQKPLTPNLVKAMLQFSAIPLAGADYLTQGAGQINAAGAGALARAIDTSARAEQFWLSEGVAPYTTIGDHTYGWSQHVIWNGAVLTGDLLSYNSSVWSVAAQWGDDNIIWGTHALLEDDNIIWGTTSVWAANLVWSDRIIGVDDGDNIIWGTDDGAIIWGTLDFENIIWGTWDGDNIIWGTWDAENIIWGTAHDGIIWGTFFDDDNIIWGTYDEDNVIWGTLH
jgi:serine protease AprX